MADAHASDGQDKIRKQIADKGLPTAGSCPFRPKLFRNRAGELEIRKTRVSHGRKSGKKGFEDVDGRIWIRDRAHSGLPDHWDVQEDDGRDYLRIGLDGEPLR
jgi:hypothetical protein